MDYTITCEGTIYTTQRSQRTTVAPAAALSLADEQIARWQAFRARYAKGDPNKDQPVTGGWLDTFHGLQSQIDRLSGADEANAEAIQRMHERMDKLDLLAERLYSENISAHGRIDDLQDEKGEGLHHLTEDEADAIGVALGLLAERPVAKRILRGLLDRLTK